MADSLFRMSSSGLLRTSANSSNLQKTLSRSMRPENNVTTLSETLMDTDDSNRGRSRMDVLFTQFFNILQAHTSESETFDVLLSLSLACKAVVEQLQLEIEEGMGGEQGAAHRTASINWLKQEINTWRLLHGIYYDRILVQTDTQADDEMQEGGTLGGSEKMVITQLYAINSTLREYQLVVDWLEASYDGKDAENLLHYHDRMMAWENTLFQLENLQGVAFGKKHEIVTSLDPDAPVRENRPLHALDEEDNMRLGRAIFGAIRRGSIDDALKLCKHYGQTWKAAILEGWRLHEDPNFELGGSLVNEKLPIEGNPRRDVWKRCAWRVADSNRYDVFTRATAGVFSGHLTSLKALPHSNWHDLLWAHIKVQIDIRVESEIREYCTKRYQDMPEDYWNGKMTLEQIFDELNVAKDVSVKDFAKGHLGIIQRHLILDTCGELIQQMVRWLETDISKLSSHQLRFMAHIVLFLRQIGRVENEKMAEKIIASYVEALLARGDAQLIAYYCAPLSNRLQVKLYSQFLEKVEQKRARELAIDSALQAGLDVEQITRFTVENIRHAQYPLGDLGEPHAGEISASDQFKIAALEWLIFLPEQRSELLWQACAMMRIYLASNKIECMRQTFLMVPGDVVTRLIGTVGSLDNLPPREECSLKEYLCYKVYLTGVDSFVEWNCLYKNPPQKPVVIGATSQDNFTERLVCELKQQTYRSELERWEQKVKEEAKQTTEALYNILTFPEKGWLVDPFISKEPANAAQLNWENRQLQMEKLRSICLPEIALLLHEVMSKSGDLVGCVRLADELASEHRQLYKVYTKHQMAELLSKIADTSLELLNSKLDPWGYPITV
ncbi:GL26389 [Drosophila persimilis]|uniref:Nuclear pore complex protein n=1 Tax=Drosophila persimilis TaxID=7234 RepID=B4GSZ6_DROPE|nr:nuclear pore complex protein Nup107 [Drosophila persimilis]EDW25505.1 GL26389 [Drosophila persimilis]